MDTSRRAFLRGAGAVVATGATGGASAVAGAAAESAAAAAGFAGAVAKVATPANKVAKVFEMLGRDCIHKLDFIKGIARGRDYRDGTLVDISQSLVARLLGKEPWKISGVSDIPRGDLSNGLVGKICFNNEVDFFHALRACPKDLPLMDFFSEEMAGHVEKNASLYKLNGDNVRRARAIFKPLCTAETTAGDLMKAMNEYFSKLAKHALSHPDDFGIWTDDSHEQLRESVLTGRSGVRHLIRSLEGMGRDNPDLKLLAESLEKTADEYEARVIPGLLENSRKKWEQRMVAQRRERHKETERRWQKDLENFAKREANPALRSNHRVVLVSLGAGRYMMNFSWNQDISPPTRMDWLHFIQKIDPKNADISDFTLEEGGLIVTFRNKKVIGFIENRGGEQSRNNERFREIALPNRRMGVDLNQPRPPELILL